MSEPVVPAFSTEMTDTDVTLTPMAREQMAALLAQIDDEDI